MVLLCGDGEPGECSARPDHGGGEQEELGQRGIVPAATSVGTGNVFDLELPALRLLGSNNGFGTLDIIKHTGPGGSVGCCVRCTTTCATATAELFSTVG